jgi:hypothetical protein
VLGRVRPKAPLSLLQLARTPVAVPAAGLVPGHGDMHEPLKEVLLRRLGRPPDIFERLVRLEVFAAGDLPQPGPQPSGQVQLGSRGSQPPIE